jgi:hypothetical protein
MESTEPTSRILNTIRSPLVFNALLTILIFGALAIVTHSDLPPSAKVGTLIFAGVWTVCIIVWTSYMAWKNPRALAYGPNEYLQESKLAHAREMARIKNP